jgi:hypothetical protein
MFKKKKKIIIEVDVPKACSSAECMFYNETSCKIQSNNCIFNMNNDNTPILEFTKRGNDWRKKFYIKRMCNNC